MIRRPRYRVLIHPDYLRLEEELRNILRAQASVSPFSRVLVLAPTQLQVLRIREAILEQSDAVLGVEILHFQAMAYRILSAAGGPAPGLASTPLLEGLVRQALESLPENALTAYAGRRPGALPSLCRLISELRESLITPDELEREARTEMARDLSRLLDRYQELMNGWSEPKGRSWTDRSGLVQRAVKQSASVPEYDRVLVYGAHELVGMNLELVKAIPSKSEITFLVPADPVAPAWEYAREFIRNHLTDSPEVLEDTGMRPFVTMMRNLGNGAGTTPALEDTAITFAHTQGPEAELTLAARKAMVWIREGVPPWRIAVIARTLEPYVSLGETVFARHGLSINASATLPLSRYPLARNILLLLRAVGRDFERQVVIELTRSPFLKRPGDHESGRWRPGSWDQWSRAYGITRGVESWVETLPDLVRTQPLPPWMEKGSPEAEQFLSRREDDGDSARELASMIETWDRERGRWKKCRTGKEHGAWLSGFVGRWIRREGAATMAAESAEIWSAFESVLEELGGLEAAQPGREALSVSRVQSFVETSLETAALPWRNPAGVHFLDFMQVRGLSFDHVVMIGFNDQVVPRSHRDRPYLSELERERLKDMTGKTISVESTNRNEERLLFAQATASATRSLTVAWQRADAGGKVLGVSRYLRDLAAVLPGFPSPEELLSSDGDRASLRIPTHPGKAADWFLNTTGLITREEAALITAESHRNDPVTALQEFSKKQGLADGLAAGLDLVRNIEDPRGEDLSYDADVTGTVQWERDFSDASLKRLGRCPLTFFFRYILKIRPLDETIKDFRLDSRELGYRIHDVLQSVFGELRDQGLLGGDTDGDTLAAAGEASLNRHWGTMQETLGRRIRLRFPLLYELTQTTWRKELSAFLEADLRRLAESGHRLESLEASWNITLPLPKLPGELSSDLFGPTMSITGIPDRVTRDADGERLISDYKTGGKLDKWVNALEYLRGHRVQLPLYVLLAEGLDTEGPVRAELLGLGPSFQPERGYLREGPVALNMKEFQSLKTGFVDTLAVMNALVTQGRFPFNDDFRCIWCEFDSACRRTHYSSLQRVKQADLFRDYFQTLKKIKRRPHLEDVVNHGD